MASVTIVFKVSLENITLLENVFMFHFDLAHTSSGSKGLHLIKQEANIANYVHYYCNIKTCKEANK